MGGSSMKQYQLISIPEITTTANEARPSHNPDAAYAIAATGRMELNRLRTDLKVFPNNRTATLSEGKSWISNGGTVTLAITQLAQKKNTNKNKRRA
jgi:hypothetical protein